LTVRGLWRVERVAWAGADIGIHPGASIRADTPGTTAAGSRQSGALGKFRDVAVRHRGGVSAPDAQAATTPAQQPKYSAIPKDARDRKPVDPAGHLAIGCAKRRIGPLSLAEHGEPDDFHG
jgi:hypothetical protein